MSTAAPAPAADELLALLAADVPLLGAARLPTADEVRVVFGPLADAWGSPRHPIRVRATGLLDLGSAVARSGLDALAEMLEPGALVERMAAAWALPHAPDGVALHVRPAGRILHVAAGNTFLGAVESVVHGLLSGSVNYWKTAEGDRALPHLFAEALAAHDPRGSFAPRLRVLSWKGGDDAVESVLKSAMDVIVVFGGAEAVANWRTGLGVSTALLAHGPRLGLGIVSREGRTAVPLSRLSAAIAQDVAAWDQRACNSLQVLFVEGGPDDDLLDAIAGGLRRAARTWPAGPRGLDESVEVLRARALAEARHLVAGGRRVRGSHEDDWTVIVADAADVLSPSPLGRTLVVHPLTSPADLPAALAPIAPHLQTVGLAVGDAERCAYVALLSGLGATRICALGRMTSPAPGLPHEGRVDLRDFTRLLVVG